MAQGNRYRYQDQEKHETAFKLTLVRIGEDSLVYFIFTTPSYKWLVIFQVIFVAANMFLSITQEFKEELLIESLKNLPGYLILQFFCFHFMQNLRLNKFFRERRLLIQVSQTNDVLNS